MTFGSCSIFVGQLNPQLGVACSKKACREEQSGDHQRHDHRRGKLSGRPEIERTSAASPTNPRSPATCRARACGRRCSISWKPGWLRSRAGRPQASAAIILAGRHRQHPVHLRRRLLGSRADHLRARPFYLDRLCRAGDGLIAYGWQKKEGRLRCHKRPKSREETPKVGSDNGGGLSHAL
jgi:hypothetical protein